MKKRAKALPSRFYRYGARAPVAEGETVRSQMRLAHRYHNALVEVELRRRKRVDETLAAVEPALAATEVALAVAEAEVEASRGAIRAAQAAARKKVRPKALVARVAAAKAARAPLYAQRKAIRGRLFGVRALKVGGVSAGWVTPPDPRWTAAQAQIDADTLAEKKRLRAACGLYWGTYLAVEDSLRGVRKGRPPKFQRWRGDGHLAVQVQHGLSPAEALAGVDNRLRIEPVPAAAWLPGGRHLRKTTVWLRVGPPGRPKKGEGDRPPVWAKVPIVLHRPLPDDARIKWVHLLRRRVAVHDEWSVSFVLTRASGWAKPDVAAEGAVGIDVGWRLRPNGLRVAYWLGSDGAEGELVLPSRWLGGFEKVEDLRSIRDKHFDAARGALMAWLKGRDVPEWFREVAAYLPHWKSSARLARVVARWRTARFPGDADPLLDAAALRSALSLDPPSGPRGRNGGPTRAGRLGYGSPDSIYGIMEAWRQQDRHLCEWEGNQREKLQRQREDVYRNFGAQMRRRYRTAAVEALDLRGFHVLPKAEETPEEQAVRKHVRDACLSVLFRCVEEGMARLVRVDPALTTMRCADCGHVADFDRMNLVAPCPACQRPEDQDRRAARNLLAQTGGPPVAAPASGGGVGGPAGGAGAAPPTPPPGGGAPADASDKEAAA